jgi:hypothetical protein
MSGPLSRKSHKDHPPERRDLALAWVTLPRDMSSRQFGKLPPAETFKACEAQERRFEAINGKQFLESLDRMRLFEGPVFSEGPESRARKAHEFGLLITLPRGSKSDCRYTPLVRKLKKLQETDLRWLLIARWLEGEGVSKAEEFLPKEILERLLKRAKKARLRVSASDLQMTRLIRIWLPYFARLLDDRDKLLKKRRGVIEALKELSKMGYLESAADSIVGKREPVPAVITWLALSREGTCPANERTLQNAYSRVEAARRRADAKFDKWILEHPHQIDPWEYHNFLHLIS